MTINNPPQFDSIFDTNGNTLECKVLEIGDWDMEASTFVNVSHGLGSNYRNIRSVNAIIRADNDFSYYSINPSLGPSVSRNELWVSLLGSSVIGLQRFTGGLFDNPSFQATSYNRGWVMIWYEV